MTRQNRQDGRGDAKAEKKVQCSGVIRGKAFRRDQMFGVCRAAVAAGPWCSEIPAPGARRAGGAGTGEAGKDGGKATLLGKEGKGSFGCGCLLTGLGAACVR
jgi:hypothetical protein